MKKMLLLALTLSSSLALAQAPGAGFAQPHRRVDIGGRKLDLFCSGTGSPTVVFEAPSGSAGWAWWDVQPRVAAKTRACVYDRAGLGFSDPSPRAADAADAVDDLHALLQAAAISPPYVLVGNSFGGAAAQLFAWKHPGEVAGLVLVESMHEDENVRADALTHGQASAGDAQILVLVRGVSPYLIPGKPQGETNKAIEAANLELQTQVAHASANGEVRVVAGAGHEIQESHPEAVAGAVDDVLAKIRR